MLVLSGSDPYQQPVNCPIPDGQYPLTYSTEAGTVQCDGDAASVATVAGGTITFTSCYTGVPGYGKSAFI